MLREGACWPLRGNIEERACDLAAYIIENHGTVREAAGQFGISKSTVHKDLRERLPGINPTLYRQVQPGRPGHPGEIPEAPGAETLKRKR